MKINSLVKNDKGDVVSLDMSMTNEENAFFLAFAFNTLMREGLIHISEKNEVVLDGLMAKKGE